MHTITITQAWAWREVSYRIAQLLLLVGIISLPLSSYWTSKILIAAMAFVILSGNWAEKWQIIKSQRAAWCVLALYLIMLIGVFYSRGTLKATLHGFNQYNKILYFIFFLPLCTQQKIRDQLINIYLFSIVISMIMVIGNYGNQPLINAIDSSFLIGFASYIALRNFLDGGSLRWFYGIIFIFIAGYLLFYNIERTGYVVFFGAIVTLFWQYFGWRGLLIGGGVIMGLAGSLYSLNPTFKARIDLGAHEARGYFSSEVKASRALALRWGLYTDWGWRKRQLTMMPLEAGKIFLPIELNIDLYNYYLEKQGMVVEQRWLFRPHADIHGSSIGLRLGFAQYSWLEIKKHPWIGNGTGSFTDVYRAGGGPTIEGQYLPHPHNEYILMWFQYGIVGLIFFLLWQLIIWHESFKLPRKEGALLQCLLVCFALLGFCNASFSVNPAGNVFILFTAVLLAAKISDTRRGSQWTSR